MESRIEFNGRTINVKEPTISDWSKVMKYKDLLDEEELYYKMLEEFTGMEKDEILKQDAATIIRLGDVVQNILMYENKKLYKEIEHNGMTYELMDVNNISFGQYVDLDTFLRKDEKYRTQHLNELAAYMYVEKGTKYADSDFKKRIEAMKDLPIKYINSALFFFIEYSRGVSKSYPALFQEQIDGEAAQDKNSFYGHYGWYHAISQLAENKVWQIDNVVNLTLISALNHLSYLVDLNKEKEREIKKQQQQIKNR